MKKLPILTKTITVDVYLFVGAKQHFEVPLDYVISESTPEQAYKKLLKEFPDQNVSAIENPYELPYEDFWGIDFNELGTEFIVDYPNKITEEVIRFNYDTSNNKN